MHQLKNNKLKMKLPQFYVELMSYISDLKAISPTNNVIKAEEVIDQVIWLNKDITIKNSSFFWKTWYKKGIIHVRNLLDENNNFLNQKQIEDKYHIQCNFLEVLSIRQSIPLEWRRILTQAVDRYIPQKNLSIYITRNQKFIEIIKLKTNEIYWQLQKNNNSKQKSSAKCMAKWNMQFPYLTVDNWKQIFKVPFFSCTETMLQTFQYKVIHRVFPCNHWLYNCKVINSPCCTFCNKDDNIIHYFTECGDLPAFWFSFGNWWNRIMNCVIDLNIYNIILGYNENLANNANLNYCVTLAKYYIWKMKKQSNIIEFFSYLVYLKNRLEIKHLYHSINCSLEIFNLRWNEIYENV